VWEDRVVDDAEIVQRIGELAAQEHQLERSHAGKALGAAELERLHSIEAALDQCWDLLRQRRARRSVGENPDEAEARPIPTVEGYQQ